MSYPLPYITGHTADYSLPLGTISTLNTGAASLTFPIGGATNTVSTIHPWDMEKDVKFKQVEIKGSMSVSGDTAFAGDVTIKGVNLSELLEGIQDRLALLHPNKKLEEKWENLRGLRKAYMELEAEILEKEAVWATLKK